VRLSIRRGDRHIFDAIASGDKRIETRAATKRYNNLQPGEVITFSCGGDVIQKTVARVKKYDSIESMLKEIKPQDILPGASTKDVEAMYHSFSGYRDKISRYGLVALELV
jgi:ASC-1-like (ASCH) protein